MTKRTEFHTVDFFRTIRDKQAALLNGKSSAEIIGFFKQAANNQLPEPEKADASVRPNR